MVFNVNVGISSITNKDASDSKGRDIALFIGDTVVVGDGDGPAHILTTSKKKIKNIAIFLKDADSSEGEKENKNTLPDPEDFGRGKRSAVLDQKLRQDGTADEKRKKHQR
jgi:nucleosome binding factor SPN SPT16 subunit